jgi:AbrB family looped-hinge helix DNA binding protein
MNRPRSKVGERGQVTIPKRLRRSLGIRPGEEIDFEERDGALVLRRASRSSDGLDGLLGLLRDGLDVDAYLIETRGPAWNTALDTRKPKRAKRPARKARR